MRQNPQPSGNTVLTFSASPPRVGAGRRNAWDAQGNIVGHRKGPRHGPVGSECFGSAAPRPDLLPGLVLRSIRAFRQGCAAGSLEQRESQEAQSSNGAILLRTSLEGT